MSDGLLCSTARAAIGRVDAPEKGGGEVGDGVEGDSQQQAEQAEQAAPPAQRDHPMVDDDQQHQVGDDGADQSHHEAAQVDPLHTPANASQLLIDVMAGLGRRRGTDRRPLGISGSTGHESARTLVVGRSSSRVDRRSVSGELAFGKEGDGFASRHI